MAQADTPLPSPALDLSGDGDVFTYVAGTMESPVVCSFPHVGLEWPVTLGRRPQVNMRKNADLAVEFVIVEECREYRVAGIPGQGL